MACSTAAATSGFRCDLGWTMRVTFGRPGGISGPFALLHVSPS
jgi:hypothetical protein